ncbi:PTS system cellobiose-specific IIC component [Orenia metallireducens]|uniref:Permease IIC component n=1 Tax=Orenia metallireducens TaxID=1413210 RepID=A0A285GCG3_9FIRM|nr:PTS sugar transporter subunit IIC [Orenia metallireducens]PRX32473.1 PTS system cellobiose-specific IIC component [Orenia metallireducens]SNY21155.1 PTS system, cellobiose-specific IIC component [Orenia metallireducens]
MAKNKFYDFLNNKFMPVMGRIANQRHLKAVRDGLISTIPFTIVGSAALILRFPPVDPSKVGPDSNFLMKFLLAWNTWASNHGDAIMMPFQMTMALLGIFAVIGISYSLAKTYKLNELSSVGMGLMSYLLVSAPATNGTLSMTYLDAKGLFTAIVIGILSIEMLRILEEKEIKIKMPDGVPPAVASSFAILIPAFILMAVFYGASLIIQGATGKLIPEAIMAMMAPAVKAVDSPFGVFFFATLCQLLWFTGIHGAATVGAIQQAFLDQNWMRNAELRVAGEPMQYVYTTPFWSYFVIIGGSGATLALVFLYLRSRSKQLKSVGKLSLLPALFNINEPVIFGSPLVLNPIMFIPFVFVQPILGVIAYFIVKWGWVGKAFINPPWTTPAPIGAVLSTLDWKAGVLVIVLAALAGVMYYPFFKAYEKQLVEKEMGEEQESLENAEGSVSA